MRKSIFFILFSFLLVSCTIRNGKTKVVKKENYELQIADNQRSVLILFPCFPCTIENTKEEAKFLKDLDREGITVLLLSYNQKLFLTEAEKIEYTDTINRIFDQNSIEKKNIFIGGFSSGGNISILVSNFLLKTKSPIQPKGVFVVDSPLDLEELYYGAQRDLEKHSDQEAVEEAKFLTELFENELGKPTENTEKYKNASPYLISCNSTENIEYLKNIKTRFYCEPDLEWQLKNKNRVYRDLNAYKLEKTYHSLVNLKSQHTEFIKTENRGIRANGQKHPHSWNIVERESLIKWMLE